MVLLTRDPDKPAAAPDLQEQEFETVRGFYMDGLVRQIWYRGDTRGACMIVEAASAEEVTARLGALPLLRGGFLQKPLIVPLKTYPGFARRT
jgi:hypothetical protein